MIWASCQQKENSKHPNFIYPFFPLCLWIQVLTCGVLSRSTHILQMCRVTGIPDGSLEVQTQTHHTPVRVHLLLDQQEGASSGTSN